MKTAVALAGVGIRRGGNPIVRDLSVTVERRTWFGVVGANGSGKTTLLRAIAGRLPITSGRCWIGGIDVASDRAARARLVGFASPIERLPPSLRLPDLLELAAGSVDEPQERCDQL